MLRTKRDRVEEGGSGCDKGSSVVEIGGSESRVVVGMEVRSRGTRYGGGCIDCVRLVQREEIRQNREDKSRNEM